MLDGRRVQVEIVLADGPQPDELIGTARVDNGKTYQIQKGRRREIAGFNRETVSFSIADATDPRNRTIHWFGTVRGSEIQFTLAWLYHDGTVFGDERISFTARRAR